MAEFLFLSGVCIILFTDILYFASRLVIEDRTPCLSLTSNLKYKEFEYSSLLKTFTTFLLFVATPKGYLIFPLKIDNKSDNLSLGFYHHHTTFVQIHDDQYERNAQ